MDLQLMFYYVIIVILLAISLYLYVTGLQDEWYQKLTCPEWQPELFGTIIVLIIIYAISYLGLYILYLQEIDNHQGYLSPGCLSHILCLNLLLLLVNIVWLISFFLLHDLYWSLISSVILLIMVFYYSYYVSSYNLVSGILQLPFLFWVVCYVFLSLDYYKLNKCK